MSWRDFVLRLRALFFRRQMDQELEEELQFHMEMQARKNRRDNSDPKEAKRQARLEFGSVERTVEECREERGISFLEVQAKDVGYSLRVLRKSPGFTVAAVLTLALAIGANAVVFAVLNGLILRPLRLPHEESLYGIDRDGIGFESYPNYRDLRDRNHSFEDLAAYNIEQAGLDTGTDPSRVWFYEVTGNYFDVLGIQPYLGRLIHASDEHGANSAPYLVIAYSFWHTHFQDDPSVIGRKVLVAKHPFTIVGVAPPDFHGTSSFFSPDFYMPLVNQEQVHGENVLEQRKNRRGIFEAIGHLKAGVTPAQAVADLVSIGADLKKAYPQDIAKINFTLARPGLGGDFLGRPIRAFVAGLMLLAVLILLAACANLGSLFGARTADRSREIALRLALGSSRNRILRQLFTEAIMISLVGGTIGLLGSVWLLQRLSAWHPFPRFSMNIPVSPDAKVYVVALLLALVSGLLFGLVPVRQVLRADPYEIVKSGSLAPVGRRITVRDALLVVQITLCAVLVTSSIVALRGLVRSLHSNFGFEPRDAMLVETELSTAGYRGEQVPAMQKRMIDAVAAIPGVNSVGLVGYPPLAMDARGTLVFSDNTSDLTPANAAALPYIYEISPDYFTAAGTTLLAGRSFTWHDDKNSPPVAVVNQEFARKLFGSSAAAVGAYFKLREGTRVQVVGIVENGKYFQLAEDQEAALFVPNQQSLSSETWLVVRSSSNPQQLAAAIRNKLHDLDAGLFPYIQPWTKEMDGALFPSRVATVALGVLGVMGAMLSITGIFGMAAYSVSKRMRELGIRIALGAQHKAVLQAALGRAFKLLAFGSLAGLILGILASRVLAFIVYQASPRDPLVLAGAVLAMLLLGLLATWVPAQRALSVDPLLLLREE